MGFGLEVDVQRLGAVMPEVMEAKNLIDLRHHSCSNWNDGMMVETPKKQGMIS